jgi:hypothetical protein
VDFFEADGDVLDDGGEALFAGGRALEDEGLEVGEEPFEVSDVLVLVGRDHVEEGSDDLLPDLQATRELGDEFVCDFLEGFLGALRCEYESLRSR